MSMLHVCPNKDIVCGDKPERWCQTCPKWKGFKAPAWQPSQREYFAGLAMQGLCASDDFSSAEAWHVAKLAVAQADALIAALNKEPQS